MISPPSERVGRCLARGAILIDSTHSILDACFTKRMARLDQEFGQALDLVVIGDPKKCSREFRATTMQCGIGQRSDFEWTRIVDEYDSAETAIQFETAELAKRLGHSVEDLSCIVIRVLGSRGPLIRVSIPDSLARSEEGGFRVFDLLMKNFSKRFLKRAEELDAPERVHESFEKAARALQRELNGAVNAASSRRRGGRPRESDQAADAKLVEDWRATGLPKAEFARQRGLSEDDLKRAVDRNRKRPK